MLVGDKDRDVAKWGRMGFMDEKNELSYLIHILVGGRDGG